MVTEDWYFCSHRLALALAAKKAGYDVTVVTRVRRHEHIIQKSGLKLIPIEISRSGINPLKELLVIIRLISIYKRERPNIVHQVALKPVIYGSVASRITEIPLVINALAGLGFLYSSPTLKARFIRSFLVPCLKLVINFPRGRMVLQNPDDANLMCKSGILSGDNITIIRGSGVDILEFCAKPEPDGVPVVVMASRLLLDKGVVEFVEAARELKRKGICARFILVGDTDKENPSSITKERLSRWRDEGIVEVWGQRNNMPDIFAMSHVVCLPSYREGLPKVLLEAASSSRPIIATDVPGCREIVQHNINGLLVPPKDFSVLANALDKLIKSPALRKQMGANGRKLVENEFTLELINNKIISLYEESLE